MKFTVDINESAIVDEFLDFYSVETGEQFSAMDIVKYPSIVKAIEDTIANCFQQGSVCRPNLDQLANVITDAGFCYTWKDIGGAIVTTVTKKNGNSSIMGIKKAMKRATFIDGEWIEK